jgi:hypothetical protein
MDGLRVLFSAGSGWEIAQSIILAGILAVGVISFVEIVWRSLTGTWGK